MAVEQVKVTEIETAAVTDLNNQQICVTSGNNAITGVRTWGGKAGDGTYGYFSFLEKPATFSVLEASTSIACNAGAITVLGDTDGTLSGNSDTSIPSEKAIKTYVDAAVLAEDFWDRSGTTVSLKNSDDFLDIVTTKQRVSRFNGSDSGGMYVSYAASGVEKILIGYGTSLFSGGGAGVRTAAGTTFSISIGSSTEKFTIDASGNTNIYGDLNTTGSRVTKGWFADIESTNMPTVGGTSINANGVLSLTSAEVDQLENINTTTISTTQWGYLGALDQGLTTTSDVQFGSLGLGTAIFGSWSGVSAIDWGGGAAYGTSSNAYITVNTYYDGSRRYRTSAGATIIDMSKTEINSAVYNTGTADATASSTPNIIRHTFTEIGLNYLQVDADITIYGDSSTIAVFDGGTGAIGLGAAPSSSWAGVNALDWGGGAIYNHNSNVQVMGQNIYYNSGEKFRTSDTACKITIATTTGCQIVDYPTGTAGNALSTVDENSFSVSAGVTGTSINSGFNDYNTFINGVTSVIAVFDAGTKAIGLGDAPYASWSGVTALDWGGGSAWGGSTSYNLVSNLYTDGTLKHRGTGECTRITGDLGIISLSVYSTASAGTAAAAQLSNSFEMGENTTTLNTEYSDVDTVINGGSFLAVLAYFDAGTGDVGFGGAPDEPVCFLNLDNSSELKFIECSEDWDPGGGGTHIGGIEVTVKKNGGSQTTGFIGLYQYSTPP